MTYIGIDISKNSFVAAFPKDKDWRIEKFTNDINGIRKFIGKLRAESHHCVMEATGNYCFLLLYLLDKAGVRASLVNPKKIKQYFKLMMEVTKTDSKDACLIADYGQRMNPPVYKMPSETLLMLKQKRTVIRQLKKQLTATKNLQHSLKPLPVIDKSCTVSLKKTIEFLEKQIVHLEKELIQKAEGAYEQQMNALTSIKGIGVGLASALIIATGGFTYFDNAKQLSRYIGLCPTIEQSGTSINRHGHINRKGDENLRSQLYMATWSAIRWNASCRDMYLRLKGRGKSGKVALTAVANKLVRQAFAVATSNTSYIDGFVSSKPNLAVAEHSSLLLEGDARAAGAD